MRSRLRNTVLVLAGGLTIVLGYALFRVSRLDHAQVPAAPPPVLGTTASDAAARLAALVRVPTVSWGDAARRDIGAFDRIQQVLATEFPRVHTALTRETVAQWSLLFTWRGKNPALPPVLLTAHLDVVPVEPATAADWTHGPFDGAVADGAVWGRGTIDNKSGVGGLLEAVDALLAAGFTPERTIYLGFGHNEEGGGDASGAGAIADVLAERGVRDAWLLDEGGLIYDQIPGTSQPAALIGIAEKGIMTLELTAHGAGGHSSMPPKQTAVGVLARAIDRLERSQMPARLDGPSESMFLALAPSMTLPMRAVFANLWLTRPLVVRTLQANPQTNALVRTTTAPTMLEGSPKANVLAAYARATVNFRLLPGDTPAMVEAHVRDTVNDARVSIRSLGGTIASPISPTETGNFRALGAAVRGVYPQALVAPMLTVAATDTRAYEGITSAAYRFLPVYQPGAVEQIHGTNEHITIEAYLNAIRIYASVIQQVAGR